VSKHNRSEYIQIEQPPIKGKETELDEPASPRKGEKLNPYKLQLDAYEMSTYSSQINECSNRKVVAENCNQEGQDIHQTYLLSNHARLVFINTTPSGETYKAKKNEHIIPVNSSMQYPEPGPKSSNQRH